MRHNRDEPVPGTSDMDYPDRIKGLLQELWDARQRKIQDAEAPGVGRLWRELEEMVTHELDHMETEEPAL